MADLTTKDLDKIKKDIEAEFPHDPALQQVHIARKILARKAELSGLSFLDYIKQLEREEKEKSPVVDGS
ncbi:MAG: hypothetical protein JW839_13475 [Candidatus Lokiarchaeota archaeon]|nr:hypothetical protein [Candidatus Lokiarchaeota archaeon]